MDKLKIGAPTRKELRAIVAERMARKDTDGNALYLLRRGLRSLELFVTPDAVSGDLAMDICTAIDEIERIAKLEDFARQFMQRTEGWGASSETSAEQLELQCEDMLALRRALLQTLKP